MLWSEQNGKITGSRGYVVAPKQLLPIDSGYLNFKYCMNAAPSHAPMPNWPACYSQPAPPPYKSKGIIHAGTNG
jgi:hypothetical protein